VQQLSPYLLVDSGLQLKCFALVLQWLGFQKDKLLMKNKSFFLNMQRILEPRESGMLSIV